MELKVGMKVVRKQDARNDHWKKMCKSKGLEPYSVFTIDEVKFGEPIFYCLNRGYWAKGCFHLAAIDSNLEDWL